MSKRDLFIEMHELLFTKTTFFDILIGFAGAGGWGTDGIRKSAFETFPKVQLSYSAHTVSLLGKVRHLK